MKEKEKENKHVCWTRFPRESYAVLFEGKMIGIGVNPIFDAVPGAWNILTLLWADVLDTLPTFVGPAEDYPYFCGLIPYAVGTALQEYVPKSGVTLGDIALTATPQEFLDKLAACPGLAGVIAVGAFQAEFWKRANAFAENWAPPTSSNVIIGHFGQAKVQ